LPYALLVELIYFVFLSVQASKAMITAAKSSHTKTVVIHPAQAEPKPNSGRFI
jgi:hypothetical protein